MQCCWVFLFAVSIICFSVKANYVLVPEHIMQKDSTKFSYNNKEGQESMMNFILVSQHL